MKAPSEEIYVNARNTMLKSIHSVGCNSVAVVASQICEILRKFELIAVQGHPRSSILMVPIESVAYTTSLAR